MQTFNCDLINILQNIVVMITKTSTTTFNVHIHQQVKSKDLWHIWCNLSAMICLHLSNLSESPICEADLWGRGSLSTASQIGLTRPHRSASHGLTDRPHKVSHVICQRVRSVRPCEADLWGRVRPICEAVLGLPRPHRSASQIGLSDRSHDLLCEADLWGRVRPICEAVLGLPRPHRSDSLTDHMTDFVRPICEAVGGRSVRPKSEVRGADRTLPGKGVQSSGPSDQISQLNALPRLLESDRTPTASQIGLPQPHRFKSPRSERPCEAVWGRAPLIGSDRSHDKLCEAEAM